LLKNLQAFRGDAASTGGAPKEGGAAAAAPPEEEGDDEIDESGLDPDEIKTIMQQASCSRSRAVKALRKHKNLVDAILELTP